MGCYINLLKAAFIAKTPVTCPLDRSDMQVEPSLSAMVETEMIMNDFFKHMHMTVNHLSNVRTRTQEPTAMFTNASFTPVSTGTGVRRVRVRRTGPVSPPSPDRQVLQIVHVDPPLSPIGVDNVRDSMDYMQHMPLPSVFPEFNDPNSMAYRERNFIERTNAYIPAVNLFPESPTGHGWPSDENIPPAGHTPPGTPP